VAGEEKALKMNCRICGTSLFAERFCSRCGAAAKAQGLTGGLQAVLAGSFAICASIAIYALYDFLAHGQLIVTMTPVR
jgi:hypothetical protein